MHSRLQFIHDQPQHLFPRQSLNFLFEKNFRGKQGSVAIGINIRRAAGCPSRFVTDAKTGSGETIPMGGTGKANPGHRA